MPKRKQSFSNHQLSGAMLVSGSVITLTLLTENQGLLWMSLLGDFKHHPTSLRGTYSRPWDEMGCSTILNPIILYYIISHYFISYRIVSFFAILHHIIPYHIISYHITSCHIISHHIIPYHIIYILYIYIYHISFLQEKKTSPRPFLFNVSQLQLMLILLCIWRQLGGRSISTCQRCASNVFPIWKRGGYSHPAVFVYWRIYTSGN